MSHTRNIKRLILLIALSIIVIAVISAAKVNIVQFNCSGYNYKCYEAYYTELVRRQGIKESFSDLKDRYAKDYFAKAFCHPLTHTIGRTAAEKFKTPSEAFLLGDNFCSDGYYHGVLEGIAEQMGRNNFLSKLNTICSDIRGKSNYSLDYYNCAHGLGHGLMALTDDELFKSLDYCDKLTGDWEQKSCASGVFMENIVADGVNHKTKYLKSNDLLYPCDSTPEKYTGTCYFLQSSYILRLNNLDFSKTFDECVKAGSDFYRSQCYQSIGRDASGFTISDVGKTKNICLLGKDFEQQLGCFIGAARDFRYYFHSQSRAKELCDSSGDSTITSRCDEILTSY